VNGNPEHLKTQADKSLRLVGLERIELFQLHRVDPNVAFADQLGALVELQAQGKIARIGLSEVSVAQIEAARTITPIATVQDRYNLVDRGAEPVVEYCDREGIGFIPCFPMATGRLAETGGPLQRIADALAVAPAQLALAWLLHRSPVVLPIPGTATVAHLEENVGAALIGLTADQIQYFDGGALDE
jgi:pyridoxine 4-dehydrogenase